MKNKSLLFVVGARPNFIKIAPICKALERSSNVPYQIVHTGQHYDQLMSEVFFKELEIPHPDYHLNTGSGSHGKQTGEMMQQLEQLCQENSFSGMVVIGDVNSTLAGALVGSKLKIPVIHVESGLRSYNRLMPEEINRIATDHISDLLFAPTWKAMENLKREGLEERAYFSGDVMYDMILQGLQLAEKKPCILELLQLRAKSYYLATLHRPYNVDEPKQLNEIFKGLSQIGEKVILAAHPRLKKNLDQFDIRYGENILLTTPFGYLDFIMLLKNAKKIITDSGGIQKEAFFIQTPCVTLRSETEWVETLNSGANILVEDRSASSILEAVQSNGRPRFDQKPYGDGRASEIIIDLIQQRFYS